MSANVSILNNSLNKRINTILADEETDRDTRAIIDKINDQLADSQKKLDSEFSKKYGNSWKDGQIVEGEEKTETDDEKTEDTKKTESSSSDSTSSAAKKEPKPSIIDQINSGLKENQSKLDKEFSEKYGNKWENGSIVEDDGE